MLPADIHATHGGRSPAGADDDVRPDRRVAAVTLSVPVAAVFGEISLARIGIPMGVAPAGRDTMLVPAFHSAQVLRDELTR